MQVLNGTDVHADRWPAYRARRNVVARRLAEPLWLDGQYFRAGYLVRGADGVLAVMSVQAFEAVYELEGLGRPS
jgi:hypothetical protein